MKNDSTKDKVNISGFKSLPTHYIRILGELFKDMGEAKEGEWHTFKTIFKREGNTVYISNMDLREGEFDITPTHVTPWTLVEVKGDTISKVTNDIDDKFNVCIYCKHKHANGMHGDIMCLKSNRIIKKRRVRFGDMDFYRPHWCEGFEKYGKEE